MSAFHADALLFDMDGTLIDSTRAVDAAWIGLCEAFGVNAELVLPVVHGVPAHVTIAKFWPESERTAAFEWIEAAECALLDDIVPIPGARELSHQLSESGAAWGIVTSATPPLARARLEAAGIAMPEMLVTADLVSRGKPDPEPFLLGASRLGVDPRRTIVVEDAPAGIRAGRAAGAHVVVRGRQGGEDANGLLIIDDYLGTTFEQFTPEIRGRWN
ncbi:MAG: HAD-IA family hydrolase [Agromyces sp.]